MRKITEVVRELIKLTTQTFTTIKLAVKNEYELKSVKNKIQLN